MISGTKINCTVEFFGMPPGTTDLPKVDIEVGDGAGIPELVATLRQAIPTLDGPVISAGEERLLESFAFNINGEFYFGDAEVHVRKDDRVVLILLAAGG